MTAPAPASNLVVDVWPLLAGDFATLATALVASGWTSAAEFTPVVGVKAWYIRTAVVVGTGDHGFKIRATCEAVDQQDPPRTPMVAAFCWYGKGTVLVQGTLSDLVRYVTDNPRRPV